MNDVPLVKANNIHDINTSIIAIKKQLKQLNEAVGLIDMPTIDTSIFVKKSEVVDVVEAGNMNPVTSNAVVPVDEVTSGNMHCVTSNAIYRAFSGWEEVWKQDYNNFIEGIETPMGKFLRIRFSGLISGYISNGTIIVTISNSKWKPTISPNRLIIGVDTTSVRMDAGIDYDSNGNMVIYFQGNTPLTGGETVTGIFCDALLLLR